MIGGRVDTIETNAFACKATIDIDAPPSAVFDAWFDRCADWFYESEETRALQRAVMDRELGGRFYLENTEGPSKGKLNLLAHVTMIDPGKKLRLRGDFTMPHAMTANCTVAFEPIEGGCRVTCDHRMVGECDREMADGFREGWLDGLQKLKALIER